MASNVGGEAAAGAAAGGDWTGIWIARAGRAAGIARADGVGDPSKKRSNPRRRRDAGGRLPAYDAGSSRGGGYGLRRARSAVRRGASDTCCASMLASAASRSREAAANAPMSVGEVHRFSIAESGVVMMFSK